MPYKSDTRPLTSIVSYPERGEGGDNRYRGNCSPRLIEDLLGFFRPGEICDYMCGSGTTKAAADKLGVGSHLYDLHIGISSRFRMSCIKPQMFKRTTAMTRDSMICRAYRTGKALLIK